MIPINLAPQLFEFYRVNGIVVEEVLISDRQDTLPPEVATALAGRTVLRSGVIPYDHMVVRHRPVTDLLDTLWQSANR